MNKIERMLQELCPEGVEYKKLGDVCEIKGRIGFRGYTRKDLVTENEGAISLSPSNIENGCLHFDHCSYVSWAKYNESPEIMANIGDVVFTKTASVGKTALIKNLPKETTINPQLVLLKNITCNSAFLAYVLQDNRFQSEVQKITGVGSVPNVSQSALQGIEIPVPPLPIQEEIVRILDHFTELTAELQAELQARQEQYEYYNNRLLSFDDDIPKMKLNDVVTFMNGKGHEKYIEDQGAYIVVNSKFISTAGKVIKYSNSQISPLYKDMILMVMSDLPNGKALAKCFVVDADNKYTLNQRIGAFTIRDKNLITTRFLYYILDRNKQLLSYDNGADQTNLRKGDILNIIIPVPPLSEQQRIVSILDKFETLVNDLSQGLPAEITAVQEQYEYYRNKLLTFNRIKSN